MTTNKPEYQIQYAKEKLKRIPLDVHKEDYEEIKAAADAYGYPVNGFIKKAIWDKINGTNFCITLGIQERENIKSVFNLKNDNQLEAWIKSLIRSKLNESKPLAEGETITIPEKLDTSILE